MNRLVNIPLKDIRINDAFWNRYVKLVKDVIIPYQWNILNDQITGIETSHCIKNFKIAAKREKGDFYGAVFQDSDLAKWLEAVAYSLCTDRDAQLEETVDAVIDLIGEAQQEDGYLNTYYIIKEPDKKFQNLQEGHELYCAGHMMEAAVAYYKATGKTKFLHIVEKFADLICDVFSTVNKDGYPGHQEVEIGLVKLYEVTKNHKYLQMAKDFLERRGQTPNYFLEENKSPKFQRIFPEFNDYDLLYSQCHEPIRKQRTAEGHAVRAVYMYSAMADVAAEYNDEELLHVCEILWKNMTTRRMYLTGSIGSSGILERFTTDYDLPNNSNYSETCASIGLAMFGQRMGQITKESHYMDIVERALYNTVLAGIAMNGKSFFYVNPLQVWPANCLKRTSKEHIKPKRQTWFGVSCCPPNIARTLASLGNYMYFTDHKSIWINLFVTSETTIPLDEGSLTLRLSTAYPYDGKVVIDVESTKESTLYLRIPSYVTNYQITVDGELLHAVTLEKGYAKIELNQGTSNIHMDMELTPYVIHANPKVREDIGKVAVMKGSLVYCMEETDNEDNLSAYYLDTSKPLREEYLPDLLGGTMMITGSGRKIENSHWGEDELYGKHTINSTEKELRMIPYPYWANRKCGEMIVWINEKM